MIKNIAEIVRDAERAARQAFADATEGKLEPLEWLAVVQAHASNLDDLAATERLHSEFVRAELDERLVVDAIDAWIEHGDAPLYSFFWDVAGVHGVDVAVIADDVNDAMWELVESITPGNHDIARTVRLGIQKIMDAIDEVLGEKNEPHPSLTDAQRNPSLRRL